MTLQYTLTLEDQLAFTRYYLTHSAHIKKLQRKIYAVFGLVFLLSATIFSIQKGSWFVFVFNIAVFSIVFLLIVKRFPTWQLNAASRQLQASGKIADQLVEFRLTCEGIHAKTSEREATWTWTGIKDIAETPEHIFFLRSDLEAITVPRKAFTDVAEKEKFLEETRKYFADSRSISS